MAPSPDKKGNPRIPSGFKRFLDSALMMLLLLAAIPTCSGSSPDTGEIPYGPSLASGGQHRYGPSDQQSADSDPPAIQFAHPLSAAVQSLFAGTPTGSGGRGAPQGRSILSSLASLLPLLLAPRDENNPLPINVPELLRMVGVDSNKIGTMVVNAIVYVIELVSNHFFGGSNSIDGRKIDYSPTSILMGLFDTRKADSFLKTISNPDYPNSIISNLKKATGNDTVCIQQLICKMSPFWWGVNRSIRDLAPIALGKANPSSPLLKMGWKSLVMKYVPSIKEFTENSNLCEARYDGCVVVSFANKQQQQQQQNNSHGQKTYHH